MLSTLNDLIRIDKVDKAYTIFHKFVLIEGLFKTSIKSPRVVFQISFFWDLMKICTNLMLTFKKFKYCWNSSTKKPELNFILNFEYLIYIN